MPSIEIWEDTFRVNNRTDADQDQPDIVGLSNGNFLVVWREDNDTTAGGFGSDIMGQIYDPRGNEIGGEMFLNAGYGTGREEAWPSVAATADGGFVLTYSYPNGSESDYLFRRFDADGVTVGQDQYVVNDSAGGAFYSDLEIVHRPDGNSFVTYRRDNGSDESIMYRSISPNGALQNEATARGDDDPAGANEGDPDNPKATVLTDNRIVVAYQEEDNNTYGIEFRIINTNGSLGLSRQITIPNAGETNVEIAALTNGGFVITYLRGNVVYGQTFDSAGNFDSEEVALFSGSDTKTEPKVIGLKDGGYAVAFLDQTDGEVSVRAFDVNGDPTGAKADVPFEGGATSGLEMSLTADGRILIAWTNSDNSNEDVFSAILDPRGNGTINVDDGTVTVASQSGSVIRGSAADDVFYGARSADTLVGREGEDLLSGGLGRDKLDGGKNADLIFGKAGADQIFGGKGGDDIFGGSGGDKVYGGDWNDNIDGGRGNDTLLGEEGNDDISGGKGNDNVNGGRGRDELAGGSGNDRIIGGRGTDEMRGGSGQDSFIFRDAVDSRAGGQNRDTIEDFRLGVDTIDLGAIDADTTRSGNQAFDFIGAAAFSGDAGELRVKVNSQNAVIQGDRNGDGVSDFEIRLEDFGGINTFDFIL